MHIQRLPPQLANQIAAGEVVERPAAVVKELLENSLDAGATCIEINIERGGAKLIRVRDNGCGIRKDDLVLALSRHATSKISTLNDLENIISLGFRGEALASISSVSRLRLTSRTAEQTEAWHAYVEGCDQNVTLKPGAHPVGSTLTVLDLFYNTPARRKFMCTEKTEFNHINEIVRRIALSRFDVEFNLIHNGKLVHQYRQVKEKNQYELRLLSICSVAFLQHSLKLSWQNGQLSIWGWIADPAGVRKTTEMQYCYVNNRMIYDRLINHAIRQAYQNQLKDNQQPAYVLYLEVDPHQVDVNIHPAKRTLRFYQARLVHDFIYQAVTRVLQYSDAALLAEESDKQTILTCPPENRIPASISYLSLPSTCYKHTSPSSPATIIRRGLQLTNYSDNGCNGHQKYEDKVYGTIFPSATPQPHEIKKQPLLIPEHAVHTTLQESKSRTLCQVMMIHPPCYALIDWQNQPALLNLLVAARCLHQEQLNPSKGGVHSQPLLIPIRLILQKNEAAAIVHHQSLLVKMGLDIHTDQVHMILRAAPLPLRQANLQTLMPKLLGYLATQQEISLTMLAIWIAQNLVNKHRLWTSAQAIKLLTDLEQLCPQLGQSPPNELLQTIDLRAALAALNHG
ncbi:DNA mismatch repair protein MutL [Serratia symbiotica]|nr:DNA mismatch repair protein MutL [Serratia symbiotica]